MFISGEIQMYMFISHLISGYWREQGEDYTFTLWKFTAWLDFYSKQLDISVDSVDIRDKKIEVVIPAGKAGEESLDHKKKKDHLEGLSVDWGPSEWE